jgi:4-hydroxy-tetrahydrodipicolinate reductase
MKIALIGTGKMGTAIEPLAIQSGHEVVLRIGIHNLSMLAPEILTQADVAIEFTQPDAAVHNLKACLEAGVPVVCGTTGWHDQYETVKALFEKNKGSLLTASNFSIGVNLLFELNRQLSRWMDGQPAYAASVHEVHHIHKLDKPGGTAVTLAEDLIHQHHRYSGWKLTEDGNRADEKTLPVTATREGEVIGQHTVKWKSEVDEITLYHGAFNRNGFALGAVKAAEWLVQHPGVHTFRDVLFPATGNNA